MTRFVRLSRSLVLAAGLAVSGVHAQTTQPTPAGSQRYWLRVNADGVRLRSRADRNSVAIAPLGENAVLQAVSQEFGWHRVLPPDGTFSFVSAEYVDVIAPDRGIVSVRSGRLRVRVGSLVTDVEPIRAEVQTTLERGTAVHILGRAGDWLKIVPPEGVYAYISADFVEPISAEEAARLAAEAHARGSEASLGRSTPSTQPQSAPAPDLSGPWGQRLVLVEAVIEAEGRKTALDQTWEPALTRLRPIAEQREEPMVARLAREWMVRLDQRMADQAALRAARAVDERSKRDEARFQREREQIQRARASATSRPAFAARGELLESYAAREHPDRPRYKLQDPLTHQLVAYLELDPQADLQPHRLLGRYVEVYGERRTDESLGADVVMVSRIEAVRPETPTSGPARQTP